MEPLHEFCQKTNVWNKTVFGNILARKKRVLARIGGIQKALETHCTPNLKLLEAELKNEYIQVLIQEELLWKQHAKSNWNLQGDKNTAFFHAVTKSKKKGNRIEMLKLDSGVWCKDDNQLREEARLFFSKLYTSKVISLEDWHLKGAFPPLDRDDMKSLDRDVDVDEIKEAVFQMFPFKASGLDGILALFYQRNWSTVGPSNLQVSQRCLQ